jgi:putative membrane protein
MSHYYWNDWYAGWGWFLWFGIWFLLIASFGNWGYTYKVHRKYGVKSDIDILNILKERYARGTINQAEFNALKAEILSK